MGQQEIQKILRKGNWLSIKEISEILNQGVSSVTANLLRMYENGDVIRKREKIGNSFRSHYLYKLRWKT